LPGSILVAGHLSMDTVHTPERRRSQPGGAALYAALAARVLNEKVRLISAVGRDYGYKRLLGELLPSSQMRMVRSDSTRFEIFYDERWNAEYRVAATGAGRFLRAGDIISAASGCSYVHLAPMAPEKVCRVVEGLRRRHPGAVVSANSWLGYMGSERGREALKRVARDVDFFIVNEQEMARLTGVDDVSAAAKRFEARQLVVTLGELGAIYVREGRLEMMPATVGVPGRMVDATGAGDTWCGAFIGAYSLSGSLENSVLAASLLSALKCRGWSFEALVGLRFSSVEELVDHVVRLRRGGQASLKKFLGA